MKAIDTNVLVQYLMRNDPRQAHRAIHLIEQCERNHEEIFISLGVLFETIWVLTTRYDCPRNGIFEVLERLTLTPVFHLESVERIRSAIQLGPESGLDPADLLIALSAREAGCQTTITFDRKAGRSEFFELLH